ncbi:Type I phosphodiesterase/nucleotide pyrophosphatase [Candidatus Sulfopaludibacter sp. SbA3]|nr:Type I phosphodiesterase/nucleotide pyrophosphatase [Candidatus Sulfopaludibacter sp. SbA3]
MKRLLLVGWDAADWKIIRPLLASGEMPNVARLMTGGVHGNISTIYPPLSPMLWTSIATGKRAYKHGIHGFSEPAEDGLSLRPISNLGRKTKAFWNILNQNGKRSIVVGWWPSHPAEPIRGAMVSDRFPPSIADEPGTPMPPGTVWPPDLATGLSELRVHGADVTGDMLRMFVPDLDKVDQENDKTLHDLAGMIAETLSIHAAATELMEQQEWDCAAIYYVGIDHFSHRCMRYRTGKREHSELYCGVVDNAYRWHDAMLGRLLQLAGPDCAVMLTSDHGFHSDTLLPEYIPAEAAGPAVEHRHFGIFCLSAPGVRQGEEIYGATLLDIAPTVLHLWGLPMGADMDGKVLLNAFHDAVPIPPIPSWDAVAGEDGRHEPWKQYEGSAAVEALDQLVRLGYIAAPSEDSRLNVARTLEENRYNLARDYLDAGLTGEAAAIFEALAANDPEQGRYHLHLFQCKMDEADFESCGRVLARFHAVCDELAPRAAEELERRRAEYPDSEVPRDAMGRPASPEFLERAKLREKADGYALSRLVASVRLMLAQARPAEAKSEARRVLEQMEPAASGNPDFAMFLAAGYATVEAYSHALDHVRSVRMADPERYPAMALEARIHQAEGRHRECVECALDSLALVHFQPVLHYHMGVSLRHLGEAAHAEQALRVAIAQMPGLLEARDELARLLRGAGRLGEAGLEQAMADVWRQREKRPTAGAAGNAKPEPEPAPSAPRMSEAWSGSPPADRSRVVTVVTGLPRSGTSMMMQVLAAGGIDAYTDHRRTADEDNPRGYFEHDRAARLHEGAPWIAEARGKAVKVVANLLPRLPAGEEYRVVFLHRDIGEVIASQRAMLERLGRMPEGLEDSRMARIFSGQLVRIQEWLGRAPGVEWLTVQYSQALEDPAGMAASLAAFLGEPFDQLAGARAIDPKLRRQRSGRLG